MDLSGGQLTALHNLMRKKHGQPVGWISITHARALTELGLATRNPGGWQITAQGETALGAAETPDGGGARMGELVIMTPARPEHPIT